VIFTQVILVVMAAAVAIDSRAQPTGQPDCLQAALAGAHRAARTDSRLPFTLIVRSQDHLTDCSGQKAVTLFAI
jgi:hypothetical protein